MEKCLNLADTLNDLADLLKQLDNIKRGFHQAVKHVEKQARAKLRAVYLNQVMQSESVSELMALYAKWDMAQPKTRRLAFDRAYTIAATSEDWLRIHQSTKQIGPCGDNDAAARGMELAAAQCDPNVASLWINTFHETDPRREQAMRLFVKLSKA